MKIKVVLASLLLLIVFSAYESSNIGQKATKNEYPDEVGHAPNYPVDMEKYLKEKEKTGDIDSSVEKEDNHTVYTISSYNGKIIEQIPIGDNGYPVGYAVNVKNPLSKSEDGVENVELGIKAMSTFLKEAKLINQPLKELFPINTTDYSTYEIDNAHSITINVDKDDNMFSMELGYSYVVD